MTMMTVEEEIRVAAVQAAARAMQGTLKPAGPSYERQGVLRLAREFEEYIAGAEEEK